MPRLQPRPGVQELRTAAGEAAWCSAQNLHEDPAILGNECRHLGAGARSGFLGE